MGNGEVLRFLGLVIVVQMAMVNAEVAMGSTVLEFGGRLGGCQYLKAIDAEVDSEVLVNYIRRYLDSEMQCLRRGIYILTYPP